MLPDLGAELPECRDRQRDARRVQDRRRIDRFSDDVVSFSIGFTKRTGNRSSEVDFRVEATFLSAFNQQGVDRLLQLKQALDGPLDRSLREDSQTPVTNELDRATTCGPDRLAHKFLVACTTQIGTSVRAKRRCILGVGDEEMLLHSEERTTTKTMPFRPNPMGR